MTETPRRMPDGTAAPDRAPVALIVDDSPVNRKLLARHLTSLGIEAREAGDGRGALEQLRATASDVAVVLLDIVMPELDGYETLAAIKADEALRHLPVIMISGVDELDSVIRCIELGAADYLPKPFDPAILGADTDRSIDVVLLDVVMPELDGYATLGAIKGDEALRHLPVIMISGVDELDSVVRCIEMGAADYLPKPFNPAVLRARINASLAAKRLRDL
ncbi:MAG TPA: response regulator, partial [Candidatus Limnocylindrales bacterium]|nr:response regulator [Candidatus Limnocylindrales bacterium]